MVHPFLQDRLLAVSALGRGALTLVLILGGLLSEGFLQTATGQEADQSCGTTLQLAEDAYRNRNYQEAVQLASECTDPETVGQQTAVRAHRLLGLAFLRWDAPERARSAVLNLLAVDPSYLPDPVTDPPSYVRFVYNVREQAEAVGADPAPLSSPPQRSERSIFLKIGGGVSDYTGDMPPQNSAHPFDFQEFKTGNGLPLAITGELGYHFSPAFALALGVQIGNYPIVGYRTHSGAISDSDRYTHQLLGRYTFGDAGQRVSPYIDAGVSLTHGGSGTARPGYGPSLGGGLDIALNASTSIFIESRFHAIFPDDAVDGTDSTTRDINGSLVEPFDLINQLLGFGLKINFHLAPDAD